MADSDAEKTARRKRRALEAGTRAVGGIAGSAVAGPPGLVIGAAASAALIEAVDTFWGRWTDHRTERALGVLIETAAQLGSDVERVLAASESPSGEYLTSLALRAGADAGPLVGKVLAIGRALAAGLDADDETEVDEAAMVLGALADMEVPHARALAVMGTPPRLWYLSGEERELPIDQDDESRAWESRFATWSRADLHRDLPGYDLALDGVLAVLDRHGLIAPVPVNVAEAIRKREEEVERRIRLSPFARAEPASFRITPLGRSVERLLHEAALDAT